jgi:hypothetical protein
MITPQNPLALSLRSQERGDLDLRLRAEFAEMPGMKLTLPQASRLFNLDPVQCEGVLQARSQWGALQRRQVVRPHWVRSGVALMIVPREPCRVGRDLGHQHAPV